MERRTAVTSNRAKPVLFRGSQTVEVSANVAGVSPAAELFMRVLMHYSCDSTSQKFQTVGSLGRLRRHARRPPKHSPLARTIPTRLLRLSCAHFQAEIDEALIHRLSPYPWETRVAVRSCTIRRGVWCRMYSMAAIKLGKTSNQWAKAR